jgi:hemolysin activation/secretion protein
MSLSKRGDVRPLAGCGCRLLRRSWAKVLLLLCVLAQAAGAQTLPGPAQPGRPEQQLEPPTIPEPPAPPSVMPEVEPLQAPAGAEKVRFVLQQVQVEGAMVYAPADLAGTYQDLIGKEVSLVDVFGIAQRITQRYRSDGYIISRAVVPAQRIESGTVRVQVLEGFVDKVTIDGDAPAILGDYAGQIRAARPLKAADLERYLLLANDLPGVTARAVLAPSASVPQAADLIVKIERKPFDVFATFDNRGTRYVGPYQVQLGGALNSPLGLGEQILCRVITVTETEELRFGELTLRAPVGYEGTVLGALGSISRSEPGFTLEVLEIENESDTLSFFAEHPLIRSRSQTLRLTGRFDYQNLESEILGVPLSEDRLRVLRIGGFYDVVDQFSGINLFGLELSRGLNVLDATESGSPMLSRANGQSDFTKLTFSASRLQHIVGNLNLLVAASGQYAFDPLLSSEEFGLGGPEFLRAFDPSEAVGDHGLAGRIELQYLVPIGFDFLDTIQLYGFGDAGRVWNEDADFGEVERETLSSAGAGVRFTVNEHVRGGIEIAVPIEGEVAAEELHEDGSGDEPRIFGTISLTF